MRCSAVRVNVPGELKPLQYAEPGRPTSAGAGCSTWLTCLSVAGGQKSVSRDMDRQEISSRC